MEADSGQSNSNNITYIVETRLKEKMDRLGMSPYTLGRIIHSSPYRIKRWMKGEILPPLEKGLLIAKVLLTDVNVIWKIVEK